MQRTNTRLVLAVTLLVAALVFAAAFFLSSRRDDAEKSWTPAAEGFLAVPRPCCTEASLWDSLDDVTDDGQRPRPASADEAARWLDEWPYRARDDRDDEGAASEKTLSVGARSSEVRCVGPPRKPDIPRRGYDAETLETLRFRPECSYAKWKVWSGETAEERLNERHTIWADELGYFHGRVDYWR